MALIRKPSACVMKNMQKMLSSNNGRFIVGQMWIVSVILLLTTIIFTVNAEQAHFEGSEINRRQSASHVIVDGFEAKDVQPSSKRSDDIQRHSPKLSTYKKELLGCPNTAKKIMLSMVLEKTNWDDIIDKKRDRALSKLSKLFNVPKDLMVTTNIIQRDISEMEKFALQKGPNVPKNRKRFGKVEFVIGCSDYFTAGNTIAKRISRQMEENLISETSGLNFDWWCIWEKQPNSRTPRSKRDAESVKEGSGEEDDLDDYYYDDDDVDPTEKPAEPEKKIDEHPHRHHHGDDTLSKKDRNEKLMNEKLTALDSAEPKTSDRNIIDMETHQQIKTKPIETQTLASEQSSIQEEVTQLKSVITKTIENNNENVKEVEEELEKIANERKAATEKVILTDAFDTRNDFEPIVETFSEDDAIVIKPKQTIDDQHTAEAQENDYVIEDNTMKNGKLATVDIDNERQSIAITNKPNESHFTTNEFDDGKVINKGFDDVTIGLETAKASWDITQPPSSSSSSSSSSSTSTATTSQESSSTLTTPKLIAETSESQTSTATTTTTTTTTATTPTTSTTVSTTVTEAANLPVSVTNKVDSMPITVSNSVSSETNSVESTLRTSEMTTPKVTLPAKNNANVPSTVPSGVIDGENGENTDANEYDDAYDDEDEDINDPKITSSSSLATPKTTIPVTTTPMTVPETVTPERTTPTPIVTTASTTLATTTVQTTTTEAYIELENINNAPMIKARLAKLAVTAGKPFNHIVPMDTFYDAEDGTNLKLELLDKHERPLEAKSWIQYNAETRNIYGLPLKDAVSKWQFKLRATDNANESVVESLDISVQQHKSYRSVNHEIIIGVNLLSEFASNIDWEMRLIKGIVDTLGDTSSTSSVLVRDIRHGIQDPNSAFFVYTNESLPKDTCPETQLNEILAKLTTTTLNASVSPQMSIKSIEGKTIGTCSKPDTVKPTAPKPTSHTMKNYPPIARNQVDRVNATMNQLLVFKVPHDTFYDPEDGTELKLKLLTYERNELDPKYWLQFDSKNQEFYGIPKSEDVGQREYVLVAEDREGLQATDALVVVVSRPNTEYNNAFEFTLSIQFEDFNNSLTQRRFVERVAQIFDDPTTSNIQLRSIRMIHQTGATHVSFINTTLYRPHNVCPTEEIDKLKMRLMHRDGSIRPRVKDIIGSEFGLSKIHLAPRGPCLPGQENIHHAGIPGMKPESGDIVEKDDNLLTIVLPAVIILSMLFLTCIIACILYRKRSTGKLELGDEEERRSFRSKGIPVIFQDELDEKPEIGNKSPIILKDEKPPLLPPSYNSTNPDDHEDLEDYIPPPAVAMSGRESRGKSPVTPSYRKPPPYVSP